MRSDAENLTPNGAGRLKKFYIYLHCKPNGVPFYVGKGSGKRAYNLKRRNKHHSDVVLKYGPDSILVYVFECDSEEESFVSEKHVIAQLRAEGYHLANVTDGGDGVSGLRKEISEEQKKILSERLKGNKNGLGYRHTEETRKEMSRRMFQRPKNPEAIKKLAAINRKRVVCLETGVEYESVTQAAEANGIKHRICVSRVCKGIEKTANGKRFRYIN